MSATDLRRRRLLQVLTATGFGGVFGRTLLALAGDSAEVTPEMIRQAEWVSGLELTEAKRELMLEQLSAMVGEFETLRAVAIDNSVPPVLYFSADPAFEATDSGEPSSSRPEEVQRGGAAAGVAGTPSDAHRRTATEPASEARPATDSAEDLAFSSIAELGTRLRNRQVSSVELTRLYLDRIEAIDPVLRCVISRTDDLALEQAERADRELAAGRDRGPLHGLPWGAKDILAVPGYPTTWGATPFKDQIRPDRATVVAKLEEAGTVLIAKTSVGALAWGDVWFDATTKNPWNTEQGSSGSSAGSASATAAGLMSFAIGTETWGSIVSPCTRCGATGLRPTFGRVSRAGVMALSWSMDKIGPIARSADDCARVFAATHGPDALDPTTVDRPFTWPASAEPARLRIGFVQSQFEEDRGQDVEDEDRRADLAEWQRFDRATLDTLEGLGFQLVPIELPDSYPVDSLSFILWAEAAAAFDELTRGGGDEQLVRQVEMAWPNFFRLGQMVPAVEYIRANRIRTLVQREMEKLMSRIDLYVSPSFGGSNLLLTNLTGHPQVVLPNGFRSSDGTPTSITFTGGLWRESSLLAVASAYQEATSFHSRRPRFEV
jgi:Asp-tRNA(Asn)/Glu-tRNA(Gln) amidotransferase A subunit family amidase